ncbi:short-chain oxidoreductase [Cantharellus anzutake]|uniref:short-chain oxidoreductase n=1 Tax=Cantharellus anzutake TaxID=1750568 RepID=UPI001903EAC9|nr:short-chain oxidoreductase [Cantharellus anzutake]KAF8316509.1 short-chain oxidoreductase [Cantharellus anzutake]
MSSESLVWFITGTSSGFGHDLTLAALQHGDKVIATARQLSAIEGLKEAGASVLELDVASPLEEVKYVAEAAHSIYGRIDVVVNNAGYAILGALEERTPEETLEQFNVNVLGGLNVARAFLPYQRKAKTGTIVWIGSMVGWFGALGFALYSGTKHAIRAIAETLHEEISPLGLRLIVLEPGMFRTAGMNPGKPTVEYVNRVEDYKTILEPWVTRYKAAYNNQPGDPKKFVKLLIDYVKLEGPFSKEQRGDKEVPISFPVGPDAYVSVTKRLSEQLKMMEDWKDVIRSTNF